MNALSRTLLSLGLAALPLFAAPESQVPESGFGPRVQADRMAKALALTDAQKASIKAIHDKHRDQLAAQRKTVREAHSALRAALQDTATPEAQLRALYDKAAALRFDMMLARRGMRQEVQGVLTPEQRVKAAELRGMAQARHQERMRHMRMAMGQRRWPG